MFLRSGLVFGVYCLIVASAVPGAVLGPTVIVDPTPGPSHGFGTAVAATARFLYVGDPRATSGETGLVWAFPRLGRRPSAGRALSPPSGLDVESFGAALAVDDRTLVVGAPGSPYVGSLDIGDVFVYRLHGRKWSLEAHLQPSDAIEGGRFGAAVAIEGDRLVVGAPGQTPGYYLKQPGRFYVFERDLWGWQETQRVVGPGSSLGTSVDISGDTVAVGDPNGPTGDRYQRGRVSVYRLGDWSLDLEAQLIGFRRRPLVDGTLRLSDRPRWRHPGRQRPIPDHRRYGLGVPAHRRWLGSRRCRAAPFQRWGVRLCPGTRPRRSLRRRPLARGRRDARPGLPLPPHGQLLASGRHDNPRPFVAGVPLRHLYRGAPARPRGGCTCLDRESAPLREQELATLLFDHRRVRRPWRLGASSFFRGAPESDSDRSVRNLYSELHFSCGFCCGR